MEGFRKVSHILCLCDVSGEWVHGLREGRGREVTQNGIHEGEWKANNKQGSGTERSLVGTVYEGRWLHNQKSSRGVRKMVFGDQEEQVSAANFKYLCYFAILLAQNIEIWW